MIDLSNCKKGDILICKHGVIKEYISPTDKNKSEGYYDHKVKYLYIPYSSIKSIEYRNDYKGLETISEGTLCNDGFVFRKNRLESDSDVIKVIDRQVFKRYLKMLSNKL